MPTIPTKTDSSIGRVLRDRPRKLPADLRYDVPAETFERLKDAIIANATGIGDPAAPGAGSVEEALEGAASPVDRNVFHYLDDFFRVGPAWTQSTSGAGAKITHLKASDTEAADAVGAVRLEVASSAENAQIIGDTEWVDPTRKPTFEARVRTPQILGDVIFNIGLTDAAKTSYARVTLDSGNWRLECASVTGASSAGVTGTTAAVAATWYRVRVEMSPGVDARLYIDGVLVATVSTAAAVPDTGDDLAPFFFVVWDAGSGGRLVVDWCDVRGVR